MLHVNAVVRICTQCFVLMPLQVVLFQELKVDFLAFCLFLCASNVSVFLLIISGLKLNLRMGFLL